MALNFTNTRESSKFAKVVVYGDAGMGKTSLCATAPDPVILSAEGGLLSLANHNIPVIEIKNAADTLEAFRFLTQSEERHRFQTICLDSISEIAEVLLLEYMSTEKDGRQAYGKLATDMKKLIRSFRDIGDKHVYFTAMQGKAKDELNGRITYAPAMPGNQLTLFLPFAMDEMLCLRVKEDKINGDYRYLQTQPDFSYSAKDRSGRLNAMEEPHLGKIFTKMLG